MWSPWWTVVAFGMVSLAADMIYEGMRAMASSLLGSLGCGCPKFRALPLPRPSPVGRHGMIRQWR